MFLPEKWQCLAVPVAGSVQLICAVMRTPRGEEVLLLEVRNTQSRQGASICMTMTGRSSERLPRLESRWEPSTRFWLEIVKGQFFNCPFRFASVNNFHLHFFFLLRIWLADESAERGIPNSGFAIEHDVGIRLGKILWGVQDES